MHNYALATILLGLVGYRCSETISESTNCLILSLRAIQMVDSAHLLVRIGSKAQ